MCIMDKVPLIDDDHDNMDFGIFNSVENQHNAEISNNTELAGGRRARQEIVNNLFM